MVQKINMDNYWFKEEDLLKPINWEYISTLSRRIQDALELYMRGKISIGKAAEMAQLHYREFDLIRSKARIPLYI